MNQIGFSQYSLFLMPALFALVSLAWSIAVIVLLVKIWRKVKHLPG
jgi:hypothetical protein